MSTTAGGIAPVGLLRLPAEREAVVVDRRDQEIRHLGELPRRLLTAARDADGEPGVAQAEIEDPPRRLVALHDQDRL